MGYKKEDVKESGIYRIYNKKSNKSYIGQSSNLSKRYTDHFINYRYSNQLIDKEIRKNLKNFEWEILEYCQLEQLDEKEKYWINYYDSYNNGYNQTKGGQSWRGESHPNAILSQKEADKIIQLLLKNTPYNEIILQVPAATVQIISKINSGQNWYKEKLNYPLAKLPGLRKLTSEEVLDIRTQYHQKNISTIDLSKQFNVSPSVIQDIVTGKTYKEIGGPIHIPKKKILLFSEEEVKQFRYDYYELDIPIKDLYNKYGTNRCTYDYFKNMVNGNSYSNIKTSYSIQDKKNKLKQRNKSIYLASLAPGISKKQLAKQFKVSERTIYRAIEQVKNEL